MGLVIINNTLLLKDLFMADFNDAEQATLKTHFGDAKQINTEFEIKYIINRIGMKNAIKMVNLEHQGNIIEINFSKELDVYLANYKGGGLHGYGLVAGILISINKTFCNIKKAENTAEYLKALGFGMHKEVIEEINEN